MADATISQISDVPSLAVTSIRSMANERPLMPIIWDGPPPCPPMPRIPIMPMPIMPIPIMGLSSKVRQATADLTSGAASVASARGKRVTVGFNAGSGLNCISRSVAAADRRDGPICIIMPGPAPWWVSGAVTRSTARPSAEVHQHLVPFGRRNHQVSHFHRLGKQPAIAGDHEERPAVGEAQIEVAGIGGIQQAQAHHADGHIRDRSRWRH